MEEGQSELLIVSQKSTDHSTISLCQLSSEEKTTTSLPESLPRVIGTNSLYQPTRRLTEACLWEPVRRQSEVRLSPDEKEEEEDEINGLLVQRVSFRNRILRDAEDRYSVVDSKLFFCGNFGSRSGSGS